MGPTDTTTTVPEQPSTVRSGGDGDGGAFPPSGGGSGPAGWHLMSCPECLFELDLILLAEAPATAEEEAILDELLQVTVGDLLERLRPRIAWSG